MRQPFRVIFASTISDLQVPTVVTPDEILWGPLFYSFDTCPAHMTPTSMRSVRAFA